MLTSSSIPALHTIFVVECSDCNEKHCVFGCCDTGIWGLQTDNRYSVRNCTGMGLCDDALWRNWLWFEVEHVKSTAPFKWHNGDVTVSMIWNVNIKWELPNRRLTFWWNFIRI